MVQSVRRPATPSPGWRVCPGESRGERKERTRRAILDAALDLCEDSSLVALSLRQVAKEVGIVPTAFYRHFDSIEDLGPGPRRGVVRRRCARCSATYDAATRPTRTSSTAPCACSASTCTPSTPTSRSSPASGWPGRPRSATAIRHQIELVERELATDLARLTDPAHWSAEDLRVLSNLIVTSMVGTTEAIVSSRARDAEPAILAQARTQLRMLLVGALRWKSRKRRSDGLGT